MIWWVSGLFVSKVLFLLKKTMMVVGFASQLKQRIHSDLFEAFKLIFSTNRKIDSTNNYNQFGVSSKSDVQKVINSFSFSGLHPLVGLKYIQYEKWLNNLRASSRYSKLNYPK
uniref:homing endonuclease n=1 Tax=Fusarium boothii TaxID=282271 RepID=UPI002029128B|nr:homing endonuclease [Fusarium boothii]UPX01457.1 homing endonuclease [Fusarium boothii]UPX01512.1 homing endonuclease [Fusarium boothii]UPX01568.1 homing endonuclease [Fusarium boothii]